MLPAAGVLVLPTTVQGDLAAAFEALYARPGALPPLMQQGVMEARIPRHYVLLHDARTALPGTLERCGRQPRRVLHQLGKTSAGSCSFCATRQLGPSCACAAAPTGCEPPSCVQSLAELFSAHSFCRAQQQLRQLGASVGAQCHLLVINSRTPEQPPGMDGRFWSAAAAGAPFVHLPPPPLAC